MSLRSSQKRERSDTRPTTPPPRQQPTFGSSPPIFPSSLIDFSPRLPIRQSVGLSSPSRRPQVGFRSANRPLDAHRPSSLIGTLQGAEALLLATRELVGADEVEGASVDSHSEAEEREAFINSESLSFSEESSESSEDIENESTEDEEDDEEDDEDDEVVAPAKQKAAPTKYAREKLIGILNGDQKIPKIWNLGKILTTLIQHRRDRRIRTSYKQFRTFAYQTLMVETQRGNDCWPRGLPKKDVASMVDIRFRAQVENRFCREVQQLCTLQDPKFWNYHRYHPWRS